MWNWIKTKSSSNSVYSFFFLFFSLFISNWIDDMFIEQEDNVINWRSNVKLDVCVCMFVSAFVCMCRIEYLYHKMLLNDCINVSRIFIFLENKTRYMHSRYIYVKYVDINCLFTFVHSLGLRVYGFQVFFVLLLTSI